VFLNRLSGESIGISVFGIFVIDKNTILAVCMHSQNSLLESFVSADFSVLCSFNVLLVYEAYEGDLTDKFKTFNVQKY